MDIHIQYGYVDIQNRKLTITPLDIYINPWISIQRSQSQMSLPGSNGARYAIQDLIKSKSSAVKILHQ